MATIQLPKDFKDFLRLLNENGVDYLLVGGYAVIYYGYPRTTGDMDIWIDRAATNAGKLVVTLRRFGFGSAEVSAEAFLVNLIDLDNLKVNKKASGRLKDLNDLRELP